jgi:hypothetical protein
MEKTRTIAYDVRPGGITVQVFSEHANHNPRDIAFRAILIGPSLLREAT